MDKLSKSPRINYLLHAMGIFSFYDVVYHFPKRYENLNYTKDERKLNDKQRVVLLGRVVSVPKLIKARNITVTTFDFLTNHNTFFRVVAYNRIYLSKTISNSETYTLVATYNKQRNELNFINSYKGIVPLEQRIKPVYNLPSDYPQHSFSQLVKKSLEEVKDKIYPTVPYFFINKYRLVDKKQAVEWAHFPKSQNEIHQSLRHLKYEEALLFSLKNQLIKLDNKNLTKFKKEPIDYSLCEPWIKTLPFELTNDQKEACNEIIEDMNQNTLMYRLLQGDVGTGKTLVSMIALYANYLRGDQGVLMAPTDVLCRQHYENAKKLFENTKVKICLLLGSTPLSEKHRLYDEIESGEIDIIIGTHALFSKSVKYSSLGLAVIDEQHRFGVNQRLALTDKGQNVDLLMMSATPIPRSLALTIYGDLDVSTLSTFPSRKRDIKTEIVKSNSKTIFAEVDKALSDNRQVYVVAPLIDYSEDGRYSVETLFSRFLLKYHEKVGLLHGKMKSEEKEKTLEKFYNNETPILISTSVIEVGIDVKRANLMIIYDASNFSLASLHQLRGRIGRDGSKGKCLLTLDEEDEEAFNKLEILTRSEDGFEIAEADLKMRGPGELSGIKQSGLPVFEYLNLIDDFKIFVVARDDSKYILEHRSEKGFEWVINKAKKEIEINPLIKG